MERRRPVGGVVERRDVPEVEVERPERQGDQRVGEDLEPVEEADREDRLQQRPGQAEDQQQRGDVAEQQVLAHVGDDQLLGDVADRAREGDGDRQQAGAEADLAPERHRAAVPGEGQRALRVEDRRDQSSATTSSGAKAPGDMGERQDHGFSVAPLVASAPAPLVAWPP